MRLTLFDLLREVDDGTYVTDVVVDLGDGDKVAYYREYRLWKEPTDETRAIERGRVVNVLMTRIRELLIKNAELGRVQGESKAV